MERVFKYGEINLYKLENLDKTICMVLENFYIKMVIYKTAIGDTIRLKAMGNM